MKDSITREFMENISRSVAEKTEVNDTASDSADTTYSAAKIEERLAESAGGFLGSYTSLTRPSLVAADAGKYIYLTDTQAWVFWNGSKWSDQ